MIIRKAIDKDLKEILKIEMEAFGKDEGPEILELVNDLLEDPTARPYLSLIAENNGQASGHILFTKARLNNKKGEPASVSIAILAPLAVAPEKQGIGIGGLLVEEGLKLLSEAGVELVFVLGHPDYYPRHGFEPAGKLGYEAPYPIPDEVAGAWMVQELRSGVIGNFSGKVICADALDQPRYWSE